MTINRRSTSSSVWRHRRRQRASLMALVQHQTKAVEQASRQAFAQYLQDLQSKAKLAAQSFKNMERK